MINITYTVEIYTTEIRALGLGLCNFIGRLGGCIFPIVALGLLDLTGEVYYPYYLMIGMSGIAAIMMLFIPFRTYGKPLDQIEQRRSRI